MKQQQITSASYNEQRSTHFNHSSRFALDLVFQRPPTSMANRQIVMNFLPHTDEEVVAEQHDLEIMRRRHLWPYGSFLPLKHRTAVNLDGVSRTAILYQFDGDPQKQEMYMFLPETNIYSIPADVWTEPTRYRTGGETLLFEIIMEGWIVQ
jgi:hypothetical protein